MSQRVNTREPSPESPSSNGGPSRSTVRSPSAALRLLRQASGRRFMREPSLRVREAAEEEVEQRQSDLAYSWPVVLLDLIWNAGFILSTLIIVAMSSDEKPSAPLRIWVCGYAAQCLVHMLCVWYEYRRRQELRRTVEAQNRARGGDREGAAVRRDGTGFSRGSSQRSGSEGGSLSEALLRQRRASGDEEEGGAGEGSGRDAAEGQERGAQDSSGEADNEDDGIWDRSLARQVESVNTMFSFVWWVVGLGWLLSTFDDTFQDSPMLSWLCMIFLAFDVFFVIFCTALACVIGVAVCCCLPCIIAILYAVGDKDGASPEAIEALPRFKFRRIPTAGTPAGTQKMARNGDVAVEIDKPQEASQGGVIVPLAPSDTVKERPVALEDAECCICLSTYEDGAALRGLPCGHHFDQSCLDKWLRNKPTCPLCKYDVVKKCRSGESASASPSAFGSGDSTGSGAGAGGAAGGGSQAPPSLVSTIRATATGFFNESPSQS